VSGIIIAVSALGLSIWQGLVTRRHNIVSLRPQLTTWFKELYSDGIFELSVINNGVGPALIDSFDVLLDDKKLDGGRTEPMRVALELLFKGYEFSTEQGFIGPSYSMSSNEEHSLAKVIFTKRWPTKEQMNALILRLNIIVKYHSLYDEKFVLELHNEI